jgi:DNA invertase Pin-like site-specific DNA recombinase
MRYFIYCRKSTESEERQVASIESQLTTLKRNFGGRSDIEIVRVYEESFSAKAPGRSVFGAMMSAIEKGEAAGIVAWAPDRLARNSIDGGRIVYLLDCGVIKDLKFATYTFENNSQGKFMLQIMFGQSKYYSDALSENVLRGMRTKVEKGWHPTRPPIGYRNDRETRTVKKDPERFDRVRQIYEFFLIGDHSTKQIWKIATDQWELRTLRCRRSGGRLIPPSYIHKILTNPFYAGIIEWHGQVYQGAHEPVVSVDQFERVQLLLRRSTPPRPRTRHFTFTGLIRCGECGFSITAEAKLNRHGSHYTYYHCTWRRPDYRCRQPSVSVANLEAQIEQFLNDLTLPERILEWAIRQLSNDTEADQDVQVERRKTLAENEERSRRALENLTALRVRDVIADDEFLHERRKLETEQLKLRQQRDQADNVADQFEPIQTLLSFHSKALDWFRNGDDETKRSIFRIVGSNPVLKDKRLRLEAAKPFRLKSEIKFKPQFRSYRNELRSMYINRDPELLHVLTNIRLLENKFGIRSDHYRP